MFTWANVDNYERRFSGFSHKFWPQWIPSIPHNGAPSKVYNPPRFLTLYRGSRHACRSLFASQLLLKARSSGSRRSTYCISSPPPVRVAPAGQPTRLLPIQSERRTARLPRKSLCPLSIDLRSRGGTNVRVYAPTALIRRKIRLDNPHRTSPPSKFAA